MDSLTVFEFESNSVRVIELDGQPWFVANDVLKAIGSSTKVTDLKASVCEDLGHEFVSNESIKDSLGRSQEMLCLSEPALTLFVSRSRTELGKALNRWIHVEVLPAIRKTGKYDVAQKPELQSDLAQLMLDIIKQNEQRLTLVESRLNQLAEQQPLATPKTRVPIQSGTVLKRKKPTPIEFHNMQLQALKEIGVTDMLEKHPSTVWTKYSPEIIDIVDVCRLPEFTYLFGFPGKMSEIAYTNRMLKLLNSQLVQCRAPIQPNGEFFREFLLVKF